MGNVIEWLAWCAGGAPGRSKEEGGEEARYVRYVEQAALAAEGRVEYDMDDEDEEWLARHNKKVGAAEALISAAVLRCWCMQSINVTTLLFLVLDMLSAAAAD